MQGNRMMWAVLGGLAALSLASSALAMTSVPFGWYVEANGGSTKVSNTNYPGSSSSSGVGGNANIGYKFMPYFGAEIGYSLYPNTTIKNSVGTNAASVKNYSYDAAARGILPIGASGAEVFAKAGIDRVVASLSTDNGAAATALGISNGSHSATGLYLAAGAQYYFMPELAVVGQWARAQGNNQTGNIDLLSIGVSFIVD